MLLLFNNISRIFFVWQKKQLCQPPIDMSIFYSLHNWERTFTNENKLAQCCLCNCPVNFNCEVNNQGTICTAWRENCAQACLFDFYFKKPSLFWGCEYSLEKLESQCSSAQLQTHESFDSLSSPKKQGQNPLTASPNTNYSHIASSYNPHDPLPQIHFIHWKKQ